ncbi:NOG1 family protein [Methanopyrus kandleri]|uniref:Predicted GTPase n=2 Tax=Methanopyrus kandleri TaxID=2320 RepID=Q8TZC7_METKA|nr:NOG1 family protein [Methanopyrus kandleri]AAM01220.1 Predicted GTPase [Methanopyrus kandleri AV19]HII70860.1 NOG1 family protein [Methanopyrus kandleri]
MSGNPFRKMPEVPDPEELIDVAFRRAERAAEGTRKSFYGTRTPPEVRARSIEIARVNTACQLVQDRLWEIVRKTPNLDELHPFYRELADALAGIDRLKSSLADVHTVAKIARLIREEYTRKIKRARDPRTAAELRRQAFGRLASTIRRKVGDALRFLRKVQPKLVDLPAIDTEMFTVTLAGFPNVGKTTLMTVLTGSRPEIAPYPFTTKGIQVGYMERPYPVQMLDTPGLLERPEEERNPVERQAIAALKHVTDAVLFLIDPTGTCGYPVEEQLELLDRVRKEFDVPVYVVLTKADLRDLWEEPDLEGEPVYKVSATERTGLKELRELLNDLARGHYSGRDRGHDEGRDEER